MTEYLHQAAPDAPVQIFSDKPLKVDGVKYQPRWPWSASYRQAFRETHGKSHYHGFPDDRPYIEWLASSRSLSLTAARAYVAKTQRAA